MRDFRIRALATEDKQFVYKLIVDSMFEPEFTVSRSALFSSWKIQGWIFFVAFLTSWMIDKNSLLTFAVVLSLEYAIMILIGIYSFRRYFGLFTPEDLKEEMGRKRDYIGFWVAEMQVKRDWKIVGCIALYQLPDSILSYFLNYKSSAVSLERMYVANLARRCGIGSKLMLHAINQASNMGFQEIILDTSDVRVEAIKLYKKNGFKVVVEKPCPILFRFPKVTNIIMKKVFDKNRHV